MPTRPRHPAFRALSRWTCGLSIALALAAPAQSVGPRWASFGPGGGIVTSLAVDPGDPDRVYAVAGGSVYRSLDGGIRWTVLLTSDIYLVVIDPAHPSTLYAGGNHLFRSPDGGATWTDVTPAADPNVSSVSIGALAVSPSGGVVFAGDQARLLRSADGGGTWSEIEPYNTNDVMSIQIDPRDPETLYYATRSALFKSPDGGGGWFQLPLAGLETVGIDRLVLAPSAPDTLYLLGSPLNSPVKSAVYRSDDGAASFHPVAAFTSQTFIALQVDPRTPARLRLGGIDGLIASADGGATWSADVRGLPTRPPGDAPFVIILAAAPSRPDRLYTGMVDWGVARRSDPAAAWRIGVEPGLDAGSFQWLRFHPRRRSTVYAGIGENGERSFRSTDGGRTWIPFARGLSAGGGVNDLAFGFADPDVLYAVNRQGTWKSADEGESWTRLSTTSAYHLAVTGPRTLLAGECGVNRSRDGGRTWKPVIPCVDAAGQRRVLLSLEVDPENAANVYAKLDEIGFGENPVAFRSRDGGATWTSLYPDFAVAPSDFHVLFLLDLFEGRLLRSGDGGDSWRVVNAHLPANPLGGLAVDGRDAKTLYLVAGDGLQISRDAGRTFSPVPGSAIESSRLITDRNHPGTVYATRSLEGGLFVGNFAGNI